MKLKSGIFLIAVCLCIALMAMPASAATTGVTVTKYADNNYSAVDQSMYKNYSEMQSYTNVYSNGPVYMQGPIFLDEWNQTYGTEDGYDVWDPDMKVNMGDYGYHNGTYVYNLTDLVGGMDDGDEVEIFGGYGIYEYKQYFNKTNVYTPVSVDGAVHYPVLTWWDSVDGYTGDWTDGMRLFFYTPPTTAGVDDDLNWSNYYMRESLPEYYWHNYTKHGYNLPSAKGNSIKEVHTISIYPPHRYDFATGGDTVEYAYEGGGDDTPGLNDPSGTTVDTSKIAADDGTYDWFNTTTTDEYAAQRFVFNVTEDAANIEKLAVTWDGTSSHDNASADQDATTYIWKDGTGYQTLSGDITSDISDYIVNGNVTVLVKQNTAHSLFGEISHLATDYVKLVVTHHHTN